MTRTTRWTMLLVGIVLVVLGGSAATAQTAQEIARKAFSSTVLLVIEDSNGQPLSLGSGFFVRAGEVATNLHVVEGAARGYAKLVGEKTKYDIKGIIAVDPERDLVVLKISGGGQKILPLGNSDSVQVGDSVFAVGNPQGLEGTFSQGIISSIREVGADRLIQLTAPISPGSSGGPVLSGKGEVIGVSVATFRGGQNLNFAIPSNYLKSLAATSGEVKPLSAAQVAKNRKSILADLGGRSSEGVFGASLSYDSSSGLGDYSFSLINKLREPVGNIYCIIVFYDKQATPLDFQVVHYSGVIPAGMAKRITGVVDRSVEKLNSDWRKRPPRLPEGEVEFRVLDFEIVN